MSGPEYLNNGFCQARFPGGTSIMERNLSKSYEKYSQNFSLFLKFF